MEIYKTFFIDKVKNKQWTAECIWLVTFCAVIIIEAIKIARVVHELKV